MHICTKLYTHLIVCILKYKYSYNGTYKHNYFYVNTTINIHKNVLLHKYK